MDSALAIWQVGKGDGVFLNILNEDGSVKDYEIEFLAIKRNIS